MIAPLVFATVINVSPGFATLADAQAQVRAINRSMTEDIHVVLADGTYQLSAPLQFGPDDSGFNEHRVIWEAAPGAHPVISSGFPVTGWTLRDSTKNLWAAAVPADLDTRQLYVDGVRAQRASGPLPVTLTQTADGYVASSPIMASWRNPSDIEFVYDGGLGAGTQPRCPIASISANTIVMAQPCWDNSTKHAANLAGYPSLHLPTSVENAYELLTQPGQWYLDRKEHAIYYIPRPGENMANVHVVAPMLETLISGTGTATNPVHDITFSGLQFSYATWLSPNSPQGFPEIQAGYQVSGKKGPAITQMPGNVSFTGDHDITFQDDIFAHLGAAGLAFGDGSQGDIVQGNLFTDISGSGIELGHVDRNTIIDNYLHHLPVEYRGAVAIDAGYAQDTTIEHNQFDELPYPGIWIGRGSNHNVITENTELEAAFRSLLTETPQP